MFAIFVSFVFRISSYFSRIFDMCTM